MTDTPADILVVEDDPDLRALLLDELTDAGHTCAGCGDLSSAQGFMREQMPKMVLSDLHLPDGNGLTLLEILIPLPVTPCYIAIPDFDNIDHALVALKSCAGYLLLI